MTQKEWERIGKANGMTRVSDTAYELRIENCGYVRFTWRGAQKQPRINGRNGKGQTWTLGVPEDCVELYLGGMIERLQEDELRAPSATR
jgi:hypothetical protein